MNLYKAYDAAGAVRIHLFWKKFGRTFMRRESLGRIDGAPKPRLVRSPFILNLHDHY